MNMRANQPMHHGPAMHSANFKKLASFEVALRSKKEIAEDTYAFTFEKPAELKFKAGQHVRMSLIDPAENDAEGNKRFLTIASTPQEAELVFAMRMRNTAFKRVLGNMEPGGKVLIQILLENPHGSFALHDDASRPAIFIAGGIGIVPAYAMIKDALQRKLQHRMILFYSNRRPEDAPFLKELQALASQNTSFQFVATMTRPEDSLQSWSGKTGAIDGDLLRKYVTDIQKPIYYVAGLPEMVSTMKIMLLESGVSEADLRAEEFTGFDLNKLRSGGDGWKRYVTIIVVILALSALILVHTGAAGSLSHAGLFKGFSVSNPISYLAIGLVLALMVLKVSMALKIKRTLHKRGLEEKLTFQDVVEAHLPVKREKK